MIVFFLVCIAPIIVASHAKTITLSNTRLPRDNLGRELITGEATFLYVHQEGLYFAYFNNWGGCRGVDCCLSGGGCAGCCFSPPSQTYPDACVYTNNHTVVAYSTSNFADWTYEGTVMGVADRLLGIEFRPQVVYSQLLQLYLMWYEDRWSEGTNHGYAINAAPSPRGPFRPYASSIVLPGSGRVGDYDIFIDDDGVAYHLRTGLTITQLNATLNGPSGKYGSLPDRSLEGPSMFKRNGIYFILAGRGCCACKGGSNIRVYSSSVSPLGPYVFQGDVGSRTDKPFDRHSPDNYITRAQQTKVLEVRGEGGISQYLWVGNQWVTSTLPGNPRNNDLLYWSVLEFTSDTSIRQFAYRPTCNLSIAD